MAAAANIHRQWGSRHNSGRSGSFRAAGKTNRRRGCAEAWQERRPTPEHSEAHSSSRVWLPMSRSQSRPLRSLQRQPSQLHLLLQFVQSHERPHVGFEDALQGEEPLGGRKKRLPVLFSVQPDTLDGPPPQHGARGEIQELRRLFAQELQLARRPLARHS